MCRYVQIDEHDRLETIVGLLHAADHANDEPVDLYRQHDNLVTTDEPEDDIADANEQVRIPLGLQTSDSMFATNEGREGDGEPDDIEEFLNSSWPHDFPVSGSEEEALHRESAQGHGNGTCEKEHEHHDGVIHGDCVTAVRPGTGQNQVSTATHEQ